MQTWAWSLWIGATLGSLRLRAAYSTIWRTAAGNALPRMRTVRASVHLLPECLASGPAALQPELVIALSAIARGRVRRSTPIEYPNWLVKLPQLIHANGLSIHMRQQV